MLPPSLRRPVLIIFALACLAPALAVAQTRAKLVGRILDADKNPIEGVTVTVTSPQIPDFREVLTTDKKGVFEVNYRQIDVTYVYRFEKAGYQTMEVQQQWHLEGTQRDEWTMQVANTQAAVSGGAPVTTSEAAVAAYNAGVAALKAKDPATAEAKFGEAVAADPNLAIAWAALAGVQVQTGHNQQAAESAEKAMALGSEDQAMLTARWQAYRNLKDEAKAAEALKDLEKVGRRAEEAKKVHNEAVALAKRGDQAAAYAKFEEALKIDPGLEPSLLGLATAASKLGRDAEAASAAETVLKTDPKNEQALRLRYNAALKLNDPKRLFDSLVGLAQVEPAVASNGMLKLAFDAYDANDGPEAKYRFLKVLEFDPKQPLAHYYLALVLVNQGETAEAASHLEAFLALAPNSQQAATAREMLKQLRKDEPAESSTR